MIEWKLRPGVGIVYFDGDRELDRNEVVDMLNAKNPRPRRRAKPFARWTAGGLMGNILSDGTTSLYVSVACGEPSTFEILSELAKALNRHRVVLKRGRS